MFGMLDYRAHKLLKFTMIPLFLIGLVVSWLIFAACILFAHYLSVPLTAKIAIAWVTWQVAGILFWIAAASLDRCFLHLFYFFIDPVPSAGKDKDEAKLVTELGDKYLLNRKFETDVHSWTARDTERFAKLSFNWRARYFFNAQEKVAYQVELMKNKSVELGCQPGDFTKIVLSDLTEDIKRKYPSTVLERIIVRDSIFHTILCTGILVSALLYLEAH